LDLSTGSYITKHKEVLEKCIKKDKIIIVVFTKILNYIENVKTELSNDLDPIIIDDEDENLSN
jgi:hypothetical protein